VGRSAHSKRLHKNKQLQRSLPGFKKFVARREAAIRERLHSAVGLVDVAAADEQHVDGATDGDAEAATVRPLDLLSTLPAELAQISHARSAGADESGATVLRAHGRRVFVHNADAATTAMLTDTLNPVPKAKTSKADKKLAIRDAKRKVTLKPKLKV
jgi:hypothetical protein